MTNATIDVFCIGHASYDLVFSVPKHPGEDEKTVADRLLGCGGGPAANAAITVAKLGFSAAFAGYLGLDLYGETHFRELVDAGINTDWIVRGEAPTPLSAVLVKPDGKRALVNYKGNTQALPENTLDFRDAAVKAALFDGHEPYIALDFLRQRRDQQLATVLDAGSLHDGTRALLDQVTYLVASEKFALQYAGDEQAALSSLAEQAPVVVITLGERGLIWRRGQETGTLSAPPVACVDSTGAGDAFHGAFAAAVASGMPWLETLRYASAAGALSCTQMGARPSLPSRPEHQHLLNHWIPAP